MELTAMLLGLIVFLAVFDAILNWLHKKRQQQESQKAIDRLIRSSEIPSTYDDEFNHDLRKWKEVNRGEIN